MDGRVSAVSGRLVIGVALVALGALWTLDNLGLAEAGRVLRFWPVLPLVAGIMKLTGYGMEKQTGFGAFLTIAGGLLLLGELDFVHVSFGIVWPLLIIFVGVSLTMRAMRGGVGRGGAVAGPMPGSEVVDATADGGDYIRSFAVMGAITRRSDSPQFRGGELSAVMGGVDLILDQAKPAGGQAVVEVFAIWGGIEIHVPDDWRVEIEATPVMAGIESTARLAPGVTPVGTLIVRGFVMMGGVEIKNVSDRHRRDPFVRRGAGSSRSGAAEGGDEAGAGRGEAR